MSLSLSMPQQGQSPLTPPESPDNDKKRWSSSLNPAGNGQRVPRRSSYVHINGGSSSSSSNDRMDPSSSLQSSQSPLFHREKATSMEHQGLTGTSSKNAGSDANGSANGADNNYTATSEVYANGVASSSSPYSKRDWPQRAWTSSEPTAGPSTSTYTPPSPQLQQHSPVMRSSMILHPVSPSLPSTSSSVSHAASATSQGSSSSSSSSSSKRLLTGARSSSLSSPSPPTPLSRLLSSLTDSLRALLPSSGPKRVRTRTRRLLILLVTIALLSYFFGNTLQTAYQSAATLRRRSEYADLAREEREPLGPHISELKRHPIEELMENAKKEWKEKVGRQSKTPEEGIKEYKRRYKRDPPDGYKEWFEHAKASGTILIDEYDSLMASLEPFWAISAAELRRRTFQIGMQPSFALVHVEEAFDANSGGTFWDANEDEELIKPFGVERARGFERMVRPFVGRPGIVNMVFAINELAEPRVLVPWEEKEMIKEALATNTTVNLRQFTQLPGKQRQFFPDPVWKGDGTTWEHFIRTCPPSSAARKVYTTMTNSVIHLADVVHVAYMKSRHGIRGKKNRDIIRETLEEGENVKVEINPLRKPKRRDLKQIMEKLAEKSPQAVQGIEDRITAVSPELNTRASFNAEGDDDDEEEARPGQDGFPTNDAFLQGQSFQFNNNMTGMSHDMLCNDPRLHDTQGQFCSDFRSLDSLYPVFSPSTMPGFMDVVIPSHYYAATGPKYHLAAHIKKINKAIKDPATDRWINVFEDEPLPAWETRKNKIFWRGSTTGGGNNPAGRQLQYQRHRFLRMTSEDSDDPIEVLLPPASTSNSSISSTDDSLTLVELPSRLVNEQTMDVAFTSLDGCGHEKVCNAVKFGKYKMGRKVPLMDITKYKMLIDLDGMAYSARFMALLESGAAVLKSTIYTEYYSDQIQPWLHFIPVSVLYQEIYNIYSYFLGSPAQPIAPSSSSSTSSTTDAHHAYEKQENMAAPDNLGAHEQALQEIGRLGQEWQTQFGKTKDMEIYCYRLALEWGRLWQRGEKIGTF